MVARSDQYRFTFLTKSGDTSRVIERPFHPAPLTDGEWAVAQSEFTAYRRSRPSSACDQSAFERPANKPPIASAFYGAGGHLWVEVVTSDGRVYDVFDRMGRLIATVRGLPPTGGIDPAVTDTRLAVVSSDTADAPQVLVYRISQSAPR